MTSEENKLKAEQIKAEANVLFGRKSIIFLIKEARANFIWIEKRFNEAIEKYTAAIELNPTVAAYFTNRAFCHVKLENYGYAIS